MRNDDTVDCGGNDARSHVHSVCFIGMRARFS